MTKELTLTVIEVKYLPLSQGRERMVKKAIGGTPRT